MFGLIKGKPCMDDSMCGLGESCDPAHKVCFCNADVHTEKINANGICTNDNQCNFGLCNVDVGNGIKVCSTNNRTPFEVARYEYPGF
jgi:hypothetical protein